MYDKANDGECDDGNGASGDGCYNNKIELGWTCNTLVCPTACTPINLDGIKVGIEVCDELKDLDCLEKCLLPKCVSGLP